MVKHLIVAVFISCLLVSGCVTTPKPGKSHVEKDISLEDWMDYVAVPYLIKELAESPRFKGEPFLLVDMDRDNVQAQIDGLTLHIREEMIDALLTKPGVGLVWRPSTKPWEHHTSLTQVECTQAIKEKYYVGIDASISSINGELNVKIRALDIAEKRWVTGFGISWQGRPTSMHKNALQIKNPDNYLLGLRPLPFGKRQADLLAAYLSRNLSCLFTDMELDEAVVYVKNKNPEKIRYFENTFDLVKNYLARYREVMVTDDPSEANIIVSARAHEIHSGLYQVWMSAQYKKNGKYLPGRETEAYVSLDAPKSAVQNENKTTFFPSNPGDFGICFYDYSDSFESQIYPMLKRYPGLTGIQRMYDRCGSVPSCVCYEITVDSKRYGKMEELTQWLDTSLNASGAYKFILKPLSAKKIRITFSKGFQ